MKQRLAHTFEEIISLDNLLAAWQEFLPGKRQKPDVQVFAFRFMDHLFALRDELVHHTYRHGGYQAFKINDPKPRDIHKASVADRLLHRAIYRVLYPRFDRIFIADSFSCREGKGTHKSIDRFRRLCLQVSQNNTRPSFVLKGDIRKFFAHIDHAVLKRMLNEYIVDQNTLWLLDLVIDSFSADHKGVGLPLGNLTSQLLVNIYMNVFDQFVKHRLKAKCYIRYADDFVIISRERWWLKSIIPLIQEFLRRKLHLELHAKKLFVRPLTSGVDFLGWVHFPDHRVLRTATKYRMLRRLSTRPTNDTLQSYLGLLRHGNTQKLQKEILSQCGWQRY